MWGSNTIQPVTTISGLGKNTKIKAQETSPSPRFRKRTFWFNRCSKINIVNKVATFPVMP